ncbi:MAG: hypothetical protein RLZZ508_603 [Actinomycetota bacterium]
MLSASRPGEFSTFATFNSAAHISSKDLIPLGVYYSNQGLFAAKFEVVNAFVELLFPLISWRGKQVTEDSGGQVPPSNAPDQTAKAGCWVGWIGLLIGIAPMIIGLIGSIPCGPSANEGNCPAAAAPWLLFLSIPFGLIVGVVGIVIYIVAKTKKKS